MSKKLEENLLEVFLQTTIYVLCIPCLIILPKFMHAFCITVVNILLAVLSLSGAIGVSNFCLKSSNNNTNAFLIFFPLIYLVGTFEAQRDILSFFRWKKLMKTQIFQTTVEYIN